MIETWVRDMVAILVGIVTVSGVILAAQWLYYWPKVLSVVKEAVGDAMITEHEYVQREMSRIDSRHDFCIRDTKASIAQVDAGLREDIRYIRGRLDWLIDTLIAKQGGNHG